MIRRSRTVALAALALAIALAAGPAHADAIDGNWCHAAAGRMTINGPSIVTPGGTAMQGTYGRHSFSYVVPDAEPRSGEMISMLLVDDNTLHLSYNADGATPAPQTWHRCPADVS